MDKGFPVDVKLTVFSTIYALVYTNKPFENSQTCFTGDSKNCHGRGVRRTQPARNIPGIFAECYLSVAMFGTFREHLGDILNEKIS